MSDLREKGTRTRRRVLGDAHVDRSIANQTPADAPFQALITDAAWGHVWARDTISLRERSMMTIALLAGLGNDHELALHLRASGLHGVGHRSVGLQLAQAHQAVPLLQKGLHVAGAGHSTTQYCELHKSTNLKH